MATPTADNAAATVKRWQRNAEAPTSHTAVLGLRMLAGEWTSSADAIEGGASGGLVTQVCTVLRAAGYTVQEQARGGNGKAFRIKPTRGQAKAVRREQAGTSHPQLGAVLTVRALALDEGGALVVHLSNGNGSAWLAQITGHVE